MSEDALQPPAGLQADWVVQGSTGYRRIVTGLFLAGFATFSLIYCVQPLLPVFAAEFGIGPASSSLSLSLTTGCLALSILCAGALSEALGRRGVMFSSMCAAAFLNLAAALAPSWPLLLVARALEGVVLGGVPAVAMAYLAEEIDPRGLGLAMGLYVGGTAFGGMAGRVLTGLVAEFATWRLALGVMAGLGLLAAIGFALLLPASRHFVRKPGFDPRFHLQAWSGHLRNPALPLLFLIGLLVMGAFVTVYNYAAFRLLASPYGLNQAQVGSIFLVYLCGMVASSMAGALADRLGRAPVLIAGLLTAILGVLLTLLGALSGMISGIVVLTIGFFVAHSVASGWVGRLAAGTKGHAAALYLLAYYTGSSIMGSIGGWFWGTGGWPLLAGFTLTLLVIALLCAARLRAITPALVQKQTKHQAVSTRRNA